MSNSQGWIGVDLDGTLAYYDGWKGSAHIGAPIPVMVERVKRWLAEGKEVRIFSARVSGDDEETAYEAIRVWCLTVFGQVLRVTCTKDYHMIALYDDRCIQVEPNTGRLMSES
jgi:hypothetical protein